jgi:6,7-dimethyl-8-ribityllumazine synthase
MAKSKKSSKGKDIHIAVVVSKFNENVTQGLLVGALKELTAGGIAEKNIKVVMCPGAFEIPLTAKTLCKSKKYSAVICLGAVIKGETAHFEYISYAVTKGIMELNLEYGIPVSFGVLTSYSEEQAVERSKEGESNKGAEAAQAALEMIKLLKTVK